MSCIGFHVTLHLFLYGVLSAMCNLHLFIHPPAAPALLISHTNLISCFTFRKTLLSYISCHFLHHLLRVIQTVLSRFDLNHPATLATQQINLPADQHVDSLLFCPQDKCTNTVRIQDNFYCRRQFLSQVFRFFGNKQRFTISPLQLCN